MSAADVFVKADKERLEQAFSNILGNAIKFTQAGKIKVSCAKLESEKLEIRISDAGTGNPPEILPRLFEKFVTKDIRGNNRHGSGLGLHNKGDSAGPRRPDNGCQPKGRRGDIHDYPSSVSKA